MKGNAIFIWRISMQQDKRIKYAVVILLLLFVIGNGISVLPFEGFFLLRDMSSLYYIVISFVLLVFFQRCVVEQKLRTKLVLIAGFIVLWFVFRIEKYVAFEENVTVMRYLWYAYYIPILLIPQLSLETAIHVDRQSNCASIWSYITRIVSIIFLVLFFTNDYHQAIFCFREGINAIDAYSYGITYYIAFGWIFVIMLASVCILVYKSSFKIDKKYIMLQLIYATLFLTFLVLRTLDVKVVISGRTSGEIPEIISFLLAGILVLCVCLGLIPSNFGYARLLEGTGLAFQVANKDYEIVYKSPAFKNITREQMEHETIRLDGDTRIYRKDVSGGYAYWQVDVRELNRLNQELENATEVLSEEAEIIRLHNELIEKQAIIDMKTKVYDEIAVRVLPQSIAIEALTKDVDCSSEQFDCVMKKVCVYASYIKRMSNLMLLASETSLINKIELFLSINEVARYMRKLGVVVDVRIQYESEIISSSTAISVFEKFWIIVEQSFDSLIATSAYVCDDAVKLVLEGVELNQLMLDDVSLEIDDETSFASIFYGKDGE